MSALNNAGEGCMQVCAIRLPVEILEANLREILEALLIWSDDTKNKFKLKVSLCSSFSRRPKNPAFGFLSAFIIGCLVQLERGLRCPES
jgi:hypothetical protein